MEIHIYMAMETINAKRGAKVSCPSPPLQKGQAENCLILNENWFQFGGHPREIFAEDLFIRNFAVQQTVLY